MNRNITVTHYQPVAKNKNIVMSCSGGYSLAPVEADARRLDQGITNLLANALKFAKEGGAVHGRVLPEDPAGIRVEVQDSGIGIPPDEIPNLFQNTAKPTTRARLRTREPD